MIRFAPPRPRSRKLWLAAATAALTLGVAVPAAWASAGHHLAPAAAAPLAQPSPSERAADSASPTAAGAPFPSTTAAPRSARPSAPPAAPAPVPSAASAARAEPAPRPDTKAPVEAKPATAPAPAPAPAAPRPAAPTGVVVTVAGSGGQAMVDRCIGPIHFTPLDSYSLFIVEHDLCGGWAQFSGLQVGQKVTISGYGTYTAAARAQVPQGGTTSNVRAAFGHYSRAYLQTCVPGTSQMLLIALD